MRKVMEGIECVFLWLAAATISPADGVYLQPFHIPPSVAGRRTICISH